MDRHKRYARGVGRISMIVYAPRFYKSPARQIDSHLRIIAAKARSRLGFLFSAYRTGLKLSEEAMPDLITTQDPFGTGLVGLFLKWKLKIPLEVQNHSDFFDNYHWISERPLLFSFFNILGKWIIRKADSLRVINHTEAEKYYRLKIPRERVRVLPTPVNLERFSPKLSPEALKEFNHRWNLSQEEKILLWVGRAVWFKRVPILLQAVEQLLREGNNLRCFIVGDGLELSLWKSWAKKLSISERVIFTGFVPHADLPIYFFRCDLLVHPSIYEGLGKTMVEAGAAGKPVVAARSAGAKEVVADGLTGILADPENPQDLARKIKDLLDHPHRLDEMGRNARKIILEKFDRDRAIDDIVAFWRERGPSGSQ